MIPLKMSFLLVVRSVEGGGLAESRIVDRSGFPANFQQIHPALTCAANLLHGLTLGYLPESPPAEGGEGRSEYFTRLIGISLSRLSLKGFTHGIRFFWLPLTYVQIKFRCTRPVQQFLVSFP